MKTNWKKSVSIFALTGILAVSAVAASGAVRQKIEAELRPDIVVKVNGKTQTYQGHDGKAQYAISYNGTTYLPVRAVGEAVGMDVDWDSKTQTVSLTATTTNGVGTASTNDIGQDRAKAIALKDAGLRENEVTMQKVKLDHHNGRSVYEVEFYTDTKEYDYEIDALNGTILEREQEARQKPAQGTDIGLARAKEIALKHAGLKASEVRFTEEKKDWDDGHMEYQLEFSANGMEYDYTVDGATGAILEAESEQD